jgi:hypothetical protein
MEHNMTLKAITLVALATACLACAGQAPAETGSDEGKLGTLAMNLIGTDRHGQQYRLREAEFDVAPYTYYYPYPDPQQQDVITLSTEEDPDSQTLETTLLPGAYTVTLSNRLWFLEKLTPTGPERVEQAVLLSASSLYAYIYDRGTTDVSFTFGVDGELIDFRHGRLRISIEIEQVGDQDGGVTEPPPEEDAGI